VASAGASHPTIMETFLPSHDTPVRPGVFPAILAAVAPWKPRRADAGGGAARRGHDAA